MLTEATRKNIERKTTWIDNVQLRDGVPLPSWIDLSLTELCNRSAGSPKACRFCPRIDPAFYPNQNLHMAPELVAKIALELLDLDYRGVVTLCGYGEPLLHPDIVGVVKAFGPIPVEIVTNGDRLRPELIGELANAGCSQIVVSMYDGPHQVEHFHAMFAAADVDGHRYTLRDRWHDADEDFGLKLTNRAGTIDVGNQEPVKAGQSCLYLAYQLTVDWNGDVLLCVQDWNKRVRFGSLATQSLWEIWTSTAMAKRRRQLIAGDRSASPCVGCNAEGTVHGARHAEAWGATR